MKVKQYIYADHDKIEHTAIVFNNVGDIANVRVHNVIKDMELLLNQKKYNNLISSIQYLKQNSGVLIFINKAVHHDNATMKEIGTGAQILKNLGVSKMNLLTSAQTTELIGLSGFGLEVMEAVEI
jgi:3,4-dihydroxy 2-butanone 4-phosphate synthase/GTP cyclohydrolase II